MYAIVYGDHGEYSAYCTTTSNWISHDEGSDTGNWYSLKDLIMRLYPKNFTTRDRPEDGPVLLDDFDCPYEYAKAVTDNLDCVNMKVIMTMDSLDNIKDIHPELFL